MTSDRALLPSLSYASQLPIEERRRSGAVYTPEYLARFTLDLVECTSNTLLDDAPLLDPAAGGGVFLCEALRRAAIRIGGGTTPIPRVRRPELIRYATANLFGVEKDPRARAFALASLRATFYELAPGSLPAGFLERNIIVDDFLVGTMVARLRPLRRDGFAFIVGNPPYVPTTRLPAHYKNQLRAFFSTAVGRVDLYTLFFERALPLLRDDGVLAFISPDKFLISETSRRFRRFLVSAGSLRTIARFRSHKVFPNAAVVPCITVIANKIAHVSSDVRVLSCDAVGDRHVKVTAEMSVVHDELGETPWQLRPPRLLAIVNDLQRAFPVLGNLSKRISAGLATGRDSVYIRPEADFADIESELLRPAVRGRDIAAFEIVDPGLRILLPFDFTVTPPQLLNLTGFPAARRWLEQHRGDLEKRHSVRVWEKRWFDLHDQPAEDVARQSKILVPDVAQSCRFAVDHGKFVPLHSAYYIVPHDASSIDATAALLNSSTVEFLLRLLTPVAKDGFSRFRRQFLAAIPVPPISADDSRILSRGADLPREELNERARHLYNISRQQFATITQYLRALDKRPSA